MRILMVCLGNICRSPMAEGILQHKANAHGLNWVVESAGTISLHAGEPPHRLSKAVCLRNGIDISKQRARHFCNEDFEKFDKIYAMSHDVLEEIRRVGKNHSGLHKAELFLNELIEGCNESVPDPWYGGEEGFVEVFEMIDRTCEAIIRRHQ